MPSVVNKSDIMKACIELGIKSDDTVIIHSSLKSFGYVEGGAPAVIDAFREVLSDGTLCFPALRQKDFGNAYRNWDINNTPSDVGFLSETCRKRDGVLRSDQETHSVTAIGVNAEFITSAHRGGKPRVCPYGEQAFSYTSPWQRICDLGGKVVFIGVALKFKSTLLHKTRVAGFHILVVYQIHHFILEAFTCFTYNLVVLRVSCNCYGRQGENEE